MLCLFKVWLIIDVSLDVAEMIIDSNLSAESVLYIENFEDFIVSVVQLMNEDS